MPACRCLPAGLSPRARGNPPRGSARFATVGSIPACAGEPVCRRGRGRTTRVYPRVRGGTLWAVFLQRLSTGLSPRARGNRRFWLLKSPRRRSIPACAGEPWRRRLGVSRRTVYPRVRGGTASALVTAAGTAGLSPRARGNRVAPGASDESKGSIPACAGEPGCQHRESVVAGVYPRVRGGTGGRLHLHVLAQGLSPRARGNPMRGLVGSGDDRSIPACAGEPLRLEQPASR